MDWAQRLKRVFGVEIDTCRRRGGRLRITSGIEQPAVVAKILAHLGRTAAERYQPERPLGARSLPAATDARRVDSGAVDGRVLYRHALPTAGFQVRFDPERLTWSSVGDGIVAAWSVPEA